MYKYILKSNTKQLIIRAIVFVVFTLKLRFGRDSGRPADAPPSAPSLESGRIYAMAGHE